MRFSKECLELKDVLKIAREFRLHKKLGQHIMVDCNLALEVLEKLEEVCPTRECYLYELGSGLGSLTLFLKSYFDYVVSSEIDARFVNYLKKRFTSDLIDVVASDGIPLISALRKSCILVSNTPYVVSSKIVVALVKSSIKSAVLVLQEDVARKLAADPGASNYGRITAFTQTFMNVELGGSYPPNSFKPKPKVWSTVVVLKRKREWSESLRGYEEFLKCLFNQRKRVLAKRIKECLGVVPSSDLLRMRVFNAGPEYLFQLYTTIISKGAQV
ncbi:MAG: 16S rRNA (adenine(1518)-N(6)/adenine(1519)-N(6))-dimethyltransferase RsmA [Sulfolobales archaeon]